MSRGEKEPHNVAYAKLKAQFSENSVSEFKGEELSGFVDILCDEGIRSEEAQTRALLRITAINHIQMRNHITALDRANSRTQKWFIAFAVMSLIGLGVQIFRDFTAEPSVPVNPPASQPSVSCDTQQHDAASKVDQTKATPPPAKN